MTFSGLVHPHGSPISILEFQCGEDGNDSKINFLHDNLNAILNKPELMNRKIAIASIVGPFRKGKSFLLDFMLRYMYANYPSMAVSRSRETFRPKLNWIGEIDEPLSGFSWRSGTTRDTTGILVWSDVFLCDSMNGDDIAILLMDTQGLFDNVSTTEENAVVFALSTFLSSVQIVNLKQNIQENDLQNIQFASEFAKCYQNPDEQQFKPFQNLHFLIRDWFNDEAYNLSRQGGNSYLENEILANNSKKQELEEVRGSLRSSFEKIECYLMPYPGAQVATDKHNFDGRLRHIDEDFIDSLKNFVPQILAPRNLVVKKTLGLDYSVDDFLYYFKTFEAAFIANRFPKVESYYTIIVHNHYNKIMQNCVQIYRREMRDSIEQLAHKNERALQQIHQKKKSEAILEFDRSPRMGTPATHRQHTEEFDEKLEEIFLNLKDLFLKTLGASPVFRSVIFFVEFVTFLLNFIPFLPLPNSIKSFLVILSRLFSFTNRSPQNRITL